MGDAEHFPKGGDSNNIMYYWFASSARRPAVSWTSGEPYFNPRDFQQWVCATMVMSVGTFADLVATVYGKPLVMRPRVQLFPAPIAMLIRDVFAGGDFGEPQRWAGVPLPQDVYCYLCYLRDEVARMRSHNGRVITLGSLLPFESWKINGRG